MKDNNFPHTVVLEVKNVMSDFYSFPGQTGQSSRTQKNRLKINKITIEPVCAILNSALSTR